MIDVKLILFGILIVVITSVISADNATTPAAAAAPSSPTKAPQTQGTKETKQPGALASFGKMLIDIPLGIVEACKDGAEAVEKTVLAFVRGFFN